MVQSKDAISVPESFPIILKTYAKDMIRTQPYDLIRWSAAYFRCMVDSVNPPTKERFEEYSNTKTVCLTKEYLKALVKQIGKGYFLDRNLLHKRWKGLGLSETDLLVLLQTSGMNCWDTVHWLKLLSVMAGSISEDFISTISLICEILTDDLEGGPCAIPLWMFNVCYSFLATLDCSTLQNITNEDTKEPMEQMLIPTKISTHFFREALLNEWKHCTSQQSKLSSNYKFDNAYDGIKQSTEFENLISLLADVQFYKPNNIISHLNEEKDKIECDKLKLQSEIVQKVGAPWSWMYQFAEHNLSSSKSYNFIEDDSFTEFSVQVHSPMTPTAENELNSKVSSNAFIQMPFDDDLKEQTIQIENTDGSKSMANTSVSYAIPAMPGIGMAIPEDVVHAFLNYMKYRSIDENGMIYPRHFNEEKCPKMTGN